ncbi:MAG: hypothetical protein QGI63_10715 [Rhodospirillales bacterium]|jgi:hypothetical protein|nr:hypothetical protein [Rhodospirillales bacterium]
MGHRIARLALIALSAAWLGTSAAQAGDLEAGTEAYDGGEYATALAAWKRAAAAGSIAAMNAIASLHAEGEGVRPDRALAAAWYRRAAERGDAVAQLNLGDMYSRGLGIRRDPVEAYLWLGLAAAQGSAWAAQRQNEIAATMTAADIGRARARIAAWTPRRLPARP